MFGPFIGATSGPAITEGLLAFHLTGSLLHVAGVLLGHVMSGPSFTRQGETADA
ncbi:MAG: hypothetical protein ABF917_08370 [Gluconobacter oxydans]|uniref:hypothetical protein n=1 Tax=Gluconobacter oxydans TaxID=442 RepID=UPI0039E89696